MTVPTRDLTARDYRQDRADRLAKSLLHSGLTVQQMADLLECNRNTPGSWINRRNSPSPATVQRWAQITGVSYEWLQFGKGSPIPNQASKQVSEA